MSKCAYCGGAGPFTNEHVFPSWLCKRTKEYEQQFVLLKPDEFIDYEIQIRDTCGRCNHEKLGSLDDYAVTLYDKYFDKFVKHKETIDFRYDFDPLARWLLKVSYNSARVHKSRDQDELSKLTDYILTESGRPNHLAVFLRLIIPRRLRPEEKKGLPEHLQGLKEYPPYLIRIANDENPAYISLFSICRVIGINSYYFHVLLPREVDLSRQEWKGLLKEFQSSCRGAERLRPMQSRILITASEVDALDVAEGHLIKYPNLYQLEKSKE